MLNRAEQLVLRQALRCDAAPGSIMATFFIHLPRRNGVLHFGITRVVRDHRPGAVVLEREHPYQGGSVPLPQRDIILPNDVYYFVRSNVRALGIKHIIGIVPQSKLPKGTVLGDRRPVPMH
jgi:hypothetical protein